MKQIKDFTAIDFETMTAERTSACAIGLVKVRDGNIVQKFYSLINPIPDDRKQDNSQVHGITRKMVETAPTFAALWPFIEAVIGDDTIVCHNVEFDGSVWSELLSYYRVTDRSEFQFFCTYQLTGLPLKECCSRHNIHIGEHHDALDDAVACARVLLAEQGMIQVDKFKGGFSEVEKHKEAKKYNKATLKPLDDADIIDASTPFYHAKVVITGTFEAFPSRDELGRILQSLGADINTSISKKTNIVVMGMGAGSSKIQKIETLLEAGCDIKVIQEQELVSIIMAAKI